MSEMNRKLITRWFEAMNRGRAEALKLLNEIYLPKYVCHDAVAGDIVGVDGLRNFLVEFYEAFPDLSFRMEKMICEGDLVSSRFTVSGTHKGVFMGIPPTGKRILVQSMCMTLIRDGKIAEEWQVWDAHTILKHISPEVEALHLATAH